jgi:hypothetical protein
MAGNRVKLTLLSRLTVNSGRSLMIVVILTFGTKLGKQHGIFEEVGGSVFPGKTTIRGGSVHSITQSDNIQDLPLDEFEVNVSA